MMNLIHVQGQLILRYAHLSLAVLLTSYSTVLASKRSYHKRSSSESHKAFGVHMLLPSYHPFEELTAFEASYLKNEWDKHAADLTISYDGGRKIYRMDTTKVWAYSKPLWRQIESKKHQQSKNNTLDLNHLSPSLVRRSVCFLNKGTYKNAAGDSTMRDHLQMLQFGTREEIWSLCGWAKRELLSCWWENDGQSVDFDIILNSIPFIYESANQKVRHELPCVLEVPMTEIQRSELYQHAEKYPSTIAAQYNELDLTNDGGSTGTFFHQWDQNRFSPLFNNPYSSLEGFNLDGYIQSPQTDK